MRLPDDDPDMPLSINIVPMIDVIFAILAFFIIATLYLTRLEALPVNLPTATTAETQLQAPLTVTIDAAGNIALNTQPIELAQLPDAVRSQVNPNTRTLVIINADANVAHGRVVSVMDQLRQVEGIQLAIAARSQ
jgi:biopolymer transport protein ExbD